MTVPSSRARALVAALYHVALLAYPRSFRRHYGGAMAQVFADRCRAAARQDGTAGLLRLCGVELADLAVTALKEHADAAPALLRRARAAHRQGLRCGAVLGGLWSTETVTTTLLPLSGHIAHAVVVTTLLATPLLCAVAGFRTGRSDGTARSGAYAGIITALLSSALMLGSLLLVMALFWPTVRALALHDPSLVQDFRHGHARTFDAFLWGDNLGGASGLAVYALLYGTLVGALGGLFGRWSGRGTQPHARHPRAPGYRVLLLVGTILLPVAGLLMPPGALVSALVLGPVVGLAALMRARRATSTMAT